MSKIKSVIVTPELDLSRFKRVPRLCERCGVLFLPCKPTSLTCSPECRNAHTSVKTADRRSDTLRRNKPSRGYVKRNGRHEHRIIAEKKLGRSLFSWEIVHHKDGNKANNDPDNLEVMTQSEHAFIHSTERWERRKEVSRSESV